MDDAKCQKPKAKPQTILEFYQQFYQEGPLTCALCPVLCFVLLCCGVAEEVKRGMEAWMRGREAKKKLLKN